MEYLMIIVKRLILIVLIAVSSIALYYSYKAIEELDKVKYIINGDSEVLKDIKINITHGYSLKDDDVTVYTYFDKGKLDPIFIEDSSVTMYVNYKDTKFFIFDFENFDRVDGFEKDKLYMHFIKNKKDIYFYCTRYEDKKDIPIFTNKPLKDKFPKYYEKLTTLKKTIKILIENSKYTLPDEELLKISEKRLKATNHPWFPGLEEFKYGLYRVIIGPDYY
jgi:hypothetical protein